MEPIGEFTRVKAGALSRLNEDMGYAIAPAAHDGRCQVS